MYDYNSLTNDFLQYKRFLGYKYKSDEIIIKEIVKYLNDNNISIITKEITERYARINPNLAANTISRNMDTFREFCAYLKLREIPCYQIPLKLYPQNHKSYFPYIFSKKKIRLIYNNLNIISKSYHYNYYQKTIYPLIIKLLYQTGMRIGEVLNLKYKDYLDDNYFILRKTKNDEERIIILPSKLNEEFKTFYYKFKNCYMEDDKIFLCCTSTIRIYFFKVLKAANIKKNSNGPRLHDLRHTFITHTIQKFIAEGKNLEIILPVLQAYVGHKSIESITYYFHITNDILKEINTISERNLGYLIPQIKEISYE
ncbi:MAG TPA: hypothetical protein DHU33_01055 [Firmicutes bacterium]|nr:hypothetical protein [Bacillota bacterium]